MSGTRKLSLEESVELILELLEENPATIVIDALDECDPSRRYELFESLDEIVQRSTNVVKVFISSRNDGDIVCRLANSPNIYIDSTLNGEDMERFISIEVTKAIHLKRILGGQVSYALEKRIVETLSLGAQGMYVYVKLSDFLLKSNLHDDRFRWVSLQLQNLCDPRRMKIEADILHELGHLPRTLAELYAIIYDQIVQSGPSSRLIGERALKWIMVAREPLKTQELISAVAVDDAGGQYSITKDDILNMTCNLLEEDPVLDRFRFAHMSVLEYLESRADYNAEEINLLASWRCLDVILKLEPLSTIVSHNVILKAYSDFHALFHCSKVSQPQRIQSLPLRLNTLLPLNKIHQTQFQSPFILWRERVNRMKFIAETESPDHSMVRGSESPFAAVCIFGFSELLKPLVPDRVIQLNQVNTSRLSYSSLGVTGLEIAIRHNQREVVAMLLEKGINVSEYISHGETPLHLACSLGQYEIIQHLLNFGADPNMMSRTSRAKDDWNENSRSPSRSISALGFRNTQGGLGSALDEDAEAPIHSAAFAGKADSVRMLLRMGANVNLKSSQAVLRSTRHWKEATRIS
jgi:ankyrin repeat protein